MSIFLLFAVRSFAQFTDDFTDSNYTVNPAWSGDTAKFEVDTTKQLHLNAPAVADAAYLSTASGAIDSAEWEVYVELYFNPSSSNLARIYLVADQADLNNPLNGYCVKVGGTTDEVSLYRQDGSMEVELIDGADDMVNYSPVTVRIKVTRDASGNWELFSDSSGGTNYFPEGAVNDTTEHREFADRFEVTNAEEPLSDRVIEVFVGLLLATAESEQAMDGAEEAVP